MSDLRIAVIGAGVIGLTHIETLREAPGLTLSAIVEPSPAAADLAEAEGVPLFADTADLLEAGLADAVVVAAPNEAHLPLGRMLLEAGLPVLMEKPLASALAEAAELARLVQDTGVPLLVGHHRRHNPIIRAAKAAIDAGEIGDLVAATVSGILAKPDSYFLAWRIAPGRGGPLLINATHEIDLLRHFFGDVSGVSAVTSNTQRGLPVEDTAAAILTFAGGGVATLLQTDAGCGPWAWDITSGENPGRFPAHDAVAHTYAGTKAGLSLPDLTLWRHPGTPDWQTRMTPERLPHGDEDAYVAQLAHFGAVARGEAAPLNSAADGLGTMEVVEAIRLSASERRAVDLAELRT